MQIEQIFLFGDVLLQSCLCKHERTFIETFKHGIILTVLDVCFVSQTNPKKIS